MSGQPREPTLAEGSADEESPGEGSDTALESRPVFKRRREDVQGKDEDELARRRKTPRKDHRVRHWFLTWNNYEASSIQILTNLGAKAYAFQEEKSSTGTKHLQGVFTFEHARLWSSLDRKCGSKAYWERCKNVAAARNYCQKERSRNGRRWVHGGYGLGKKAIIDPLSGKTPYKWQEKIIDMINLPPDDRKISWVWSTRGRIGKSALVKHLCLTEDANYVGGKFADAFYAIKAKIDKGEEARIILFDLPRSMGNRVSYVAIESIKNGCIFSSKYESGQLLFNTPHIIVFANCEPDYHKLSDDRWEVTCLDNETDII